MIIGLHISSSGGVENAPSRAADAGGKALQIFAGSPRMWRKTTYSEEQGRAYRLAATEAGIEHSYIHVMYLTSYGSPDEEHREKSIDAFINALQNCDTIGARGAVTHLGSHKGLGFEQSLPRLKASLLRVLESDTEAEVILENSAGSGGNIGNSFEELAAIIDACGGHPRLKVCLDTAHAFTAGYDLRAPGDWDNVMTTFDKVIGLDKLSVLHINDSKADFESRVDRHENIGDGFIKEPAFIDIMNDSRVASTVGILEVPGLDGKGPDRANVERLERLSNA